MFQTRSFSFTLSNPSLTALTYEWQILNKAGSVDTSGKGPAINSASELWAAEWFSHQSVILHLYCSGHELGSCPIGVLSAGTYKLSHESGTLQGGSSQQITLQFSPHEVEDVSRVLVCHMPEIQEVLEAAAPQGMQQPPSARPGSAAAAAAAAAAALKPLVREVTGKVCAHSLAAIPSACVWQCHRLLAATHALHLYSCLLGKVRVQPAAMQAYRVPCCVGAETVVPL
jgi:hypothetical protein